MTTPTTEIRTKDPTCFRAIEVNDPHLAANPPPAFKVDYLAYVLGQIEQVLRAAEKLNVDAILWGGDIFHLKEPRHNPLWLIAKTITMLASAAQTAKLVHLGIAGNHDIKHGSLEAGLYGSPLDVVLESRQMQLLDKREFLFISENQKTRIAGGSYSHGRAEHILQKKKDGADTLITLGHFWLGTQTGEFFGEALYGHDAFKDCETDILCVGHHHEDKGVHRVHNKWFVSQGSIGITGAHPHDLQRRPAAALIEIQHGKTDVRVLRTKLIPVEDLIDLKVREELKKEKEKVDEFIEFLSQAQLEGSSPEELVTELAPSELVREKTQEYLTRAEQGS